MEKILEHLSTGIVLIGERGKVLYTNRFCLDRGLVSEDYKDKLYYEVLRSLELIGMVEEFLKGSRTEGEVVFKDRHYRLRFHREASFVEVNDITEPKKTESSHRDFVAYVSHELNTPITAVKGLLETLLLSEEFNKTLIDRAVKRLEDMRKLIESLKLITLPESALALNLTEVKVREVVNEVVEELKRTARERGVSIDTSEVESIKLLSDREKLSILLRNVIENAVKYNSEGGRVNIGARKEGDNILIVVEDTGVGIPAEELPFVFEPFFGGRNRKGMGLGLAISKKVVKLLGGDIGIESEEGKGTKVSIRFPYTSNL